MASVTLDRVSKRWGGFVGVDAVSLAVADEEFVVLLGPSGCGKTTTMRMIAGLEEPTAGEIRIDERVVNDVPPRDRDLAMVFQNYGLYPHMTVAQNIAYPLKVRRVPRAEREERVRRAAERVELVAFLHRRPAELSGGQRQRVALARAIVPTPPSPPPRPFSYWGSRSPTSTPSSAPPCGPSSSTCSASSRSRPSTSPTTRS